MERGRLAQVLVWRDGRKVESAVIGGQKITLSPSTKRARVYVVPDGDGGGVLTAMARFTIEEYTEAGRACPSEEDLVWMMRS